jgi:hypothetical protein
VAAVAAIAATLGFALARIIFDRPDRVLLANLPIIQQLDASNQNLSIEFLNALHDQAADILKPYQDEDLEHELAKYREIEAATPGERRALVENMSDGEKAALRANFIRFNDLPDENRSRLVDLNGQLRDAENSTELQRTMLAYWAWLQERRNGGADQAELRSADTIDERLALMRKIDRGRNRRDSLTLDEADKLRAAVKGFANQSRASRSHSAFVEGAAATFR